jgi:hypothetical protein
VPRRVERVYAIDKAAATLGYAPRHGVAELLRRPRRGSAGGRC